jgi:hypothetical protein
LNYELNQAPSKQAAAIKQKGNKSRPLVDETILRTSERLAASGISFS